METIIGDKSLVAWGGDIIRNGGLVAFPTETVYGLGADAFNAVAVKSIFVAKGRPQDNPLIVHISCREDVEKVAVNVPPIAYKLLDTFSPGPLTLVLHKVESLPLTTTGGLQTVGVRIPNHPLALALIASAGCPIAAPSANSSGRISPTEAQFVYDDMKGKIPLILDGGKTSVGIESTVLDLTKEIPTVLRPGGITVEMLSKVLDKVVNHKGEVIIAEAPGMKYKHYAPVCSCIGATTSEKAMAEYDRVCNEKNAVIVGSEAFVASQGARNVISLGNGAIECTSNLFSELRHAEKQYNYIILEWFPDEDAYYAINNRIHKSTGGQVL